MARAELEAWLCGDAALVASAAEIATMFRRSTAAEAEASLGADAARLAGARFVLAVLRDVFPDDASVRRWLLAPRREWAGACGVDLLWRGESGALEEMAVREWHRRTVRAPRPRRPRVTSWSR